MEEQYDIPCYEGLYTITKSGVVRSLPKPINNGAIYPGRIMKIQHDSNGYAIIRFTKNGKGKSFRLHRMLAELFIPNPDGLPTVNHKDGNKANYSLGNLEWVTFSENNKHAYQTGLKSNKGEKQSRSKLKEADVLKIRTMYPEMQQKQIAKLYGVGKTIIGNIIRREAWTHI